MQSIVLKDMNSHRCKIRKNVRLLVLLLLIYFCNVKDHKNFIKRKSTQRITVTQKIFRFEF